MRLVIICLLLFAGLHLNAQLKFRFEENIPVSVNGNQLRYPWAGGINFPIFSAVDIDMDGLEDLFVYDRSNNRAMIFINTGTTGMNGYRYAPEFASQLPALRGWALFYDYNCDGKADLFTTGVTNNGILQFRNDSQPGLVLFTAVDSMMKADYGGGTMSGIFASGFLMPHFNDIDGDGDMDILGQQFFCVGTFAYYKNMSMENYGVCDSLSKYVLQTYAWGNFALRSGVYDYVAVGMYNISCLFSTPPEDMFNYELALQDDTYAGIYTLDIDDDGDMDALIGDSGARNSLLVINGGTSSSANMVSQDTLFPSYDTPVDKVAFMTHAYIDVDHDGVKDLLVGHNEYENKRGVMFYRNTGTNSLPVFDFVTKGFLQDEMIDVGEGATPVLFDVDADGLLDLVIGNILVTDSVSGPKHGLTLFRNNGTINSPSFEYVTDDYAGLSSFPFNGPLYPAFGDLDGDGDADLLVGIQTGELYWFENTSGAGQPAIFSFVSAGFFGIDVGNFSMPQIIDLNRDGKNDLVIGKKSGVIAYYENAGTPFVPSFSSQPTKDTLGGIIVQTVPFVDGFSVPFVFEDAGSYKMLVSCMKGDVYLYGDIDGNIMGNYSLEDVVISRYQGVKTTYNISVSGGDLNGDNRTDMVIGLFGGGVQIYIQDTLTNSIAEMEFNTDFIIYPNPAGKYFKIRLPHERPRTELTLFIYDSFGRKIREIPAFNPGDLISTEDILPGIYFVSLRFNYATQTKVLVLMH